VKALIQQELIRQIGMDHSRASARRQRLRAVRAAADDVVIRTASKADDDRLRRLAELECARVPEGPTLVAEHDGILIAALPLRGGRPLADPFLPSADFVRLLEVRAKQLRPVL
jgi:hypothetical protein